jgi:hypothetical protein
MNKTRTSKTRTSKTRTSKTIGKSGKSKTIGKSGKGGKGGSNKQKSILFNIFKKKYPIQRLIELQSNKNKKEMKKFVDDLEPLFTILKQMYTTLPSSILNKSKYPKELLETMLVVQDMYKNGDFSKKNEMEISNMKSFLNRLLRE